MRRRHVHSQPMVTHFDVPKVVDEVRYLDPGAIVRATQLRGAPRGSRLR